MTLPLLFVGAAAMAQDDAGAGTPAQEAVAAQEQVQAQAQGQSQAQAQGPSKAGKTRPRKGGDIRHCLDRKTNQDIHRCAASKRGK
jgi:hypothetical protein